MLALCPNGQGAFFVTRKRPGMSENQMKMNIGGTKMGIYEELQARGLLAQVTNE